MSVAFAPQEPGLHFRVFHPQFDRERAYRLVAVSDYADSAPARLWFVTDWGGLWAVDQRRCVCLDGLSRPLRQGEELRALPKRKPKSDFD